jgi:FKBP-type peptidyl-prolyl cis-trans isomerase
MATTRCVARGVAPRERARARADASSRARGAARAPTRRAASSEDVDGSGSGDRPTTTTRRRALAASLALARAVTIDLGAVRAPSARAASSTFDDDPFARNDGARVLDRVKTSGTAATTTDEGRAKPGVSTETEAAKDETVRDEAARGAAAAPEAAPGPEAVSKPAAPKPAPPRVTESSTKVDTKALLNNTRIKTYNNAPVDFPAFLREGYDVKVIHGNDYTVREDGLIVKDYLIGEGESPKDNQECTFNYVAYNENGGTIDSTYRRGAPASTRLGINGMIPGFELGIKDMRPGGKRRIIVPPELGPPTGPATFFSAKQWEVFDIELLDVKSCSRAGGLGSFGSNIVCE